MAKASVSYIDLEGQKKTATWDQVFISSAAINAFFTALTKRFVERERVAETIKFAMMLREHVLIYGLHGTGKTAVADTVIHNILNACIWSMDFSKFMGETRVFGDFDIKHAQETGALLHLTRGSLVEANFANLGEFSDASMELQRSLLRVLNERQFIRGPQKLKVPLITAVANTNYDPQQERLRHPGLEAVLDRFLFWVKVSYVEQPEHRLEMLQIFLERKQDEPLPPLKLDDIVLVSGVILGMNLVTNTFVVNAFEELGRKFGEARKRPVSDRRWLKSAQMLEASALLNCKTEADFDDMKPLSMVWCENPEDEKVFAKVYDEVIGKWRTDQHKLTIDAEIKFLDDCLPMIPDSKIVGSLDVHNLILTRRKLIELDKAVKQAVTTSPASSKKKSEVLTQIELTLLEVKGTIDKA